ncbi:hypothetical protein NMY22_g6248 [Coprinellus aureogranulatus]|nr:hypothetical protein NMY22_g6248 [Coprinellus aureogranulatus]
MSGSIASTHRPSPFAACFKSNQALPPRDLANLKSILKSQVADLSALDKEIEELQQLLDLRRADQQRLQDGVQAHMSLVSPIRRLPAEILQQIFLLCRAAHRMPVIRKEEAPLLLTSVCRGWRDLALGTPELWDSIHIPIRYDFDQECPKFYFHIAERWLDRAKQAPLSISLYADCYGKATAEGAGEGPLETLLRRLVLNRAPRIRHLQLEILDEELLHFICGTLPTESWAMLEKITLRCVENGDGIEELPIWEAPHLRSVVWEEVCGADFFSLPIYSEQMEEVTVSKDPRSKKYCCSDWQVCSASEAHSILLEMPNLRTFKIGLDDDGTLYDEALEHRDYRPITWEFPLVLNHLTTLNLSDRYPDPSTSPIVFLQGLQLPALETLAYQLTSLRGEPDPESPLGPLPHGEDHPLVSFLTQQNDPIRIKSLKIGTEWTMAQDDFVHCLTMMPLLERLWVADCRGVLVSQVKSDPVSDIAPNASLLGRLQPPGPLGIEPSRVVCPRLTVLRFDRMADCEFEDVGSFVEGRIRLAEAFPINQSTIPSTRSNLPLDSPHKPHPQNPSQVTANAQHQGVARLHRIHIGLLRLQPDHVPRDYGPKNESPCCSLEEDLWEIGIDARIKLLHPTFWERRGKYTKEEYKPEEGRYD